MIIWGGNAQAGMLGDGGRYNPESDAWLSVSANGAPTPRYQQSAIWTGSEMIIWGGCRDGSGCTLADGKRYNPVMDSWSAMSSDGVARQEHTAVWTNSEMIVWGGTASGAGNLGTGSRYEPSGDSWRPLPAAGSPSGRRQHTAVWTGQEMIIWGGIGSGVLGDGARFSTSGENWSPVSTSGAPNARRQHVAIWSGSEMIVWGGLNQPAGTLVFGDGGRYVPAANTWMPLSLSGNPPSERVLPIAVSTSREMVVWGGYGGMALNDGSRYDFVTGTWSAMSLLGAPAARDTCSAIWTTTEMIIWGGARRNSGGRYTP